MSKPVFGYGAVPMDRQPVLSVFEVFEDGKANIRVYCDPRLGKLTAESKVFLLRSISSVLKQAEQIARAKKCSACGVEHKKAS